jgi:hypothetical protein
MCFQLTWRDVPIPTTATTKVVMSPDESSTEEPGIADALTSLDYWEGLLEDHILCGREITTWRPVGPRCFTIMAIVHSQNRVLKI